MSILVYFKPGYATHTHTYTVLYIYHMLHHFSFAHDQIKNSLHYAVEVFYEGDTELQSCGVAHPHSVFSMPLKAVYSLSSELYFRPCIGRYLLQTQAVCYTHFKIITCIQTRLLILIMCKMLQCNLVHIMPFILIKDQLTVSQLH